MLSPTSLLVYPTFLYCVFLLVAISWSVVNYLIYSRRTSQWRKSKIPFLKPKFLIGHKYFLNLTKQSYLASIDRIYRENSDKGVVGFFLATMPMVMIRDPVIIKQVFVKHYEKTFEPGLAGSRNDEVGQNVLGFCVDKGKWKSDRRTLSPMLATTRLSGKAFTKVSQQIESLLAHVEDVRSKGRPLDVQQVSLNFVIDTVSHSYFGQEANSHKKQGDLHQMVCWDHFSVAKMLRIYARMLFPAAEVFECLKVQTTKQINLMKDFISQQIEHRTQSRSYENDFVDFLMRLKAEEKCNDRGSEVVDVTNQMLGFGLSVVFGGVSIYIKVALQAIYAIHLLSLHPEHQESIRKELSDTLKKHKTREFTYDVVQDLTFTNQCLHESLRLLPGVPPITRICSEEFKVSGTEYTIKKGERIMINPYSVQRDPTYFKNPDKFDPERFSPENINAISSDCFLAFGIGPRKCPGYKISFFLMSTLIGALVLKYEIKPLSHLTQMDVTDFHPLSFTGAPKKDVFVDIVPRNIISQ